MAKIKVRRVLVKSSFFDDVCRLCDKWMAAIKSHHGLVVFNDISRSYEPGLSDLSYEISASEVDRNVCFSFYCDLKAASDVLSNLGFILRFSEDGRHFVHRPVSEVLVDECEF